MTGPVQFSENQLSHQTLQPYADKLDCFGNTREKMAGANKIITESFKTNNNNLSILIYVMHLE
jgi:hypothetical protein